MKRALLIFILVLGLSTACGRKAANSDHVAIENTIRGYVTTYNAQDYAQCLTYFTGYGDEEEALASLSRMRGLSGELELRKIGDIVITDQTARANVAFTILGEEGTDQILLKKADGHWKIVW